MFKNVIYFVMKYFFKLFIILSLVSVFENIKAAEVRNTNLKEQEFLAYEKHRFGDLSLNIITESGVEIILPDNFDELVTQLIALNRASGTECATSRHFSRVHFVTELFCISPVTLFMNSTCEPLFPLYKNGSF